MSERKPEKGEREKRIGTLCKRIMKSELETEEVKGEKRKEMLWRERERGLRKDKERV